MNDLGTHGGGLVLAWYVFTAWVAAGWIVPRLERRMNRLTGGPDKGPEEEGAQAMARIIFHAEEVSPNTNLSMGQASIPAAEAGVAVANLRKIADQIENGFSPPKTSRKTTTRKPARRRTTRRKRWKASRSRWNDD